eukprot:CAMPEP_0115165150 /NCGR_PEP_ID=MMETSP0227-20121206/73441_1 /TAXON_ID=89957 /ORGANISM="Polarella glacialis, Strain CCMP 1383" /LENGTH=50 /DNA_ID=CAMNT_0002577607 /DNA_START=19 /DNA_END=167 /DNA_ORIENTATION=-
MPSSASLSDLLLSLGVLVLCLSLSPLGSPLPSVAAVGKGCAELLEETVAG